MGTELASFATGFFNTMSDDMEVRRTEARDYFNKQVDLARTMGVQNRARIRGAVDESVTVAKKLEAMGVPRDIILAQANMDPAGLGDFYNQVVKLSANANVPINEQFFRDNYSLSQEIAAPNEDFATFFNRMYDPIITAANTDPQGLRDNPKGTIWANAFGLNQMDKARDKLATTMVAPGLTAEQAIQYGDQVVPNHPLGDVTVSPNFDKMKETTGSERDLVKERETADQTFQDISKNLDEAGVYEPEAKNAELASRMQQLYGDNPDMLHYLEVKYGVKLTDTLAEATGSSPDGVDTSGQPAPAKTPKVAVDPPPPPVQGSGPALTEDELNKISQYNTSKYEDLGDGTTKVTKDDGTSAIVPNDIIRKWLGEQLPPLRLE